MRASSHAVGLVGALLVGLVMRSPLPPCEDAQVAAVAERFSAALGDAPGLTVANRGELKRDRDTFFFKLFADAFGANPSTPYMWTALPLLRWLLPCPLWHVRRHDAVVLLARVPPPLEYFSLTTFAFWTPTRGAVFGSLGDAVNHLNVKRDADGLFAHVVAADADTCARARARAARSRNIPLTYIPPSLLSLPFSLAGTRGSSARSPRAA